MSGSRSSPTNGRRSSLSLSSGTMPPSSLAQLPPNHGAAAESGRRRPRLQIRQNPRLQWDFRRRGQPVLGRTFVTLASALVLAVAALGAAGAARADDCRPLEAVFYAQTDWPRLAAR